VDALQRTPSTSPCARSGVFAIRSQPGGADAGWVLEDDDLDPATLEIDGVSFSCDDAVFSVDAETLSVHDGALRMGRRRATSADRRAIELRDGVGFVRVTWGGRHRLLPVREFAVDEIVVGGLDREYSPPDGEPHEARIVLVQEDGRVEVPCALSSHGLVGDELRLLIHSDAEQRLELVRAYSRLRFPRLIDRGVVAAEAVVDLFRVSHYLELRETDEADPTDLWCSPDFAGGLSSDTVYRADDGCLLGHVSVTRAYSRTWLGHQLTTLKGHPESAACRVSLYHHFANVPAINDGRDDVYLLGYYDRSLRWHQLFFEGFVAWIGDPARVTVAPFDRFEPREQGAASRAEAAELCAIAIGPAREDELCECVALIRRQLPNLAVEAFDIDEARLRADALHPGYARRGVERSREVLVARVGGEIVGVALCERGSNNLSLFNLFNLAQVYARRDATQAVWSALFRAARRFYAARGIHDPVLIAPPDGFRTPGSAELRRSETMGCIVWSGRTLDQYQGYLSYCFEKISTESLTKARRA